MAQHSTSRLYALFFTLTLLSLSVMTATGMGESVPTFELTVPPLIPEQPYLKSIRVWNNNIVVESENYNASAKRWISDYHVVDLKTSAIGPLVITGCKTVRSIAESAKVVFVLCRNDRGLALLSTEKGTRGWNTQPLPVDLPVNHDQLLVASDNRLVLVYGESIYWRSDSGDWQRSPIAHPSEMQEKGPPQHALLTNENLFLGFDYGEFGGGLISIPVKARSTDSFRSPKELSSMNVIEILQDTASNVWVAGGLAHMGMHLADLVIIKKDGTAKNLLHQGYFSERRGRSSGSLQLPGKTDVSGLCVDPTGKPLLLATMLGIFEVGDDGFTDRIRGNFQIHYEMPGYSVGSNPVGMICTPDGNIVVATRSTGILSFMKKPNGYDLRQLVFRS